MSKRVLCVDDDSHVIAGLERNLRKHFTVDTALGGADALATMEARGPYAVAMVDMRMPEMDGVELLRHMRNRWPDTVRIMLTGNADQQTAMEAVNQGHIFQFLTKPCPADTLIGVLNNAIQQYHLIIAERELLQNTLGGAVKTVAEILGLVDPESFGRGETLKQYIHLLVPHLPYPQVWELEIAATLSQLGSVSVPRSVFQKARRGERLLGEEKDMLLRIPQISADLIQNIPRLEQVARIVRYQDKRFDGSGLPHDTVGGEDLPLGARILKVLGDLAQLESARCTREQALQQMRQRAGWYDPAVLDAAFKAFDLVISASADGARARQLKAQDLRPGQVLLANALTTDGTLLVRAGTAMTPLLVARLNNFAQLRTLREPLIVQDQ